RYDRGQRPTILADREPLDDVEFLGVRRAEGIDVVIVAGRQPDRIDHERVPALVMADGFAEPGRLHMFRMLLGETDAAHPLVALPYHQDFVRPLEEIHGLEKKELARHPPGQQRDWATKGSGLLPLSTSSFVACICFAAHGFKIGSFAFTIGGRSSPPEKKRPF